MFDLSGKSALIIGGSRGIGAASALTLARQGADVAITYGRSRAEAEAVIDKVKALGRRGLAIQSDASRRGSAGEAFKAALIELRRLDILVITAGTFDVASMAELTDERFEASFDLHARTTFEALREAEKYLNDDGRIITFGSILAERAPFPGLSVYTASKAAVTGLTRAAARDFGSRGITANTIQPGPVDTDMNPGSADLNPASDYQRGQTALGRYGTPEEVSGLVAYLASKEAAFVTGQSINIDGGWTA